ncbi:EamA family transporter RarD [Desulfovibrio sp. JC010]|uniref:EamA family transporter RarD n=1 Tax=Desulfovibrio sp. JC010 TaxID=2593641 RepID=UPI0013CFF426|nr:EamA family transporter RarD [Desulfovibrio sp. JC010]NDV28640.1 EamA family transporter RarD [Desulfovibrio sp. JC010]
MNKNTHDGLIYAAGAFILWGLLPIYWKSLEEVPALELLCNRIVWSLVFVGILLTCKKRWAEVKTALADKKGKLLLTLSSCLIGTNWFIYIWAVNHDHVVDTSMGYYMTPLMNALLGFIFMKDRLNRMQGLAIMLAACGVAYSIIDYGHIPYIALTLAVSFAFYGLVRKVMKVESLPGLFIETAVLTPISAAYLIWLAFSGEISIYKIGLTDNILLLGAGAATSMPLIFFAHGARRLRLVTLGMMQYIAPTLALILGVFVYHEPFNSARLITFAFIWSGIAVYVADGISKNFKTMQKISN